MNIIKEECYTCIRELIIHLLNMLPNQFTSEDIEKQGYKQNPGYITWFFKNLNLIYEDGKKNNRKLYTKNITNISMQSDK